MTYQPSYNTTPRSPSFDRDTPRKNSDAKSRLAIAALVVLVLGVLTGVLLVGQRQFLGSKASTSQTP